MNTIQKLQDYIIIFTEIYINKMKKYNIFIKNVYENEVPKEKRTLKNLPRYSTGKSKIKFTEWLGLKGNPSKGYDGKYYGWSHRAVYGFGVGDVITSDSMAHNDYKWDDSGKKIKRKEYTIKTEEEAKKHADNFRRAVS